MNFWKTKQLAEEIKADTLTESAKKNYYIGTSAITVMAMYLSIIIGTDNIQITLLEGLLTFVVMVLGINWTFQTNTGKDYITRVIILSFPLLIKIYTFALLAGFLIGIFAGISNMQMQLISPWLTLLLTAGIQLIYFWRLNTHLSTIN